MNLADLLLRGLAAGRVTHLLLYENGPWRMIRRGREALGVEYDEMREDVVVGWRYDLTTCPYCLSVWVGVVAAWAPKWLLAPFALSAIALTWGSLISRRMK